MELFNLKKSTVTNSSMDEGLQKTFESIYYGSSHINTSKSISEQIKQTIEWENLKNKGKPFWLKTSPGLSKIIGTIDTVVENNKPLTQEDISRSQYYSKHQYLSDKKQH